MNKRRIFYLIITIIFIFLSITILHHTDLTNNIALSKSIEIVIVLALLRISYGCTLYIRKLYQKRKYSYGIIMNLGLLIFIDISIVRHLSLLFLSWNENSIAKVYNNALDSFSFFAMLTLPCITVLAIYSIITNIILIKKEGFSYKNILGIVLGVFAILGLFGSQTIYLITSRILTGHQLILKKAVDIILNVVLSYLYTIILATLYCNIKAANHIPSFDQDYVIVLGSQTRKDGTLPPLLKSRVDKAIEFAKMQKEATGKDVIFIPSGGQGESEVIAEADAMKDYLIAQGIEEKSIIPENKSTNTKENLNYSNEIITRSSKDAKISFSTTNYHVFRSGVIANESGIECEGMGSKTKWYFYTNALIREFIANLVQEKCRHLGLLTVMIISTSVFIYIGYYYNLIAL